MRASQMAGTTHAHERKHRRSKKTLQIEQLANVCGVNANSLRRYVFDVYFSWVED
jgi:hypothetical protein